MDDQPINPAMTKLAAEFQELVARMNTPESADGIAKLFAATSDDLGEAAVQGARAANQVKR